MRVIEYQIPTWMLLEQVELGGKSMELIGLKKCSTCREVERLLEAQGIAYHYREINVDRPSAQELKTWYQQAGLSSTKKLVNTSGQLYRGMGLKDRWDDLSSDQQFDLLATDGMLVKRPILLTDQGQVFVGLDVKAYLNQR